ncbi:MAG: hypothetical protein KKE20_00010 [Nanoarchaeota archaeon]|nr:hypothetical protein [Nanoarchaeota archaeon]
METIGIVLMSIFIGSFGQIFLKLGMNKNKIIGARQVIKNIFKVFTNKYIIIGIGFYGFSSILWLFSMTRLDISFMYPLVSLSYLITTVFAIIFLKEKVIIIRWAGLGLIILGSLSIMIGV